MVDMLQNYTAMTMLGNSEFIALLKQSNVDSQELSTAAGIPEAQLKYVSIPTFTKRRCRQSRSNVI